MDAFDKVTVELDCPKCGFSNPVTIEQLRLGDAVICRGCKTTLRFVDFMGGVEKAKALINGMISKLSGGPFKITLRI
jgi:hypothetical protein